MKKFFLFLLTLPMLLIACSSENDTPDEPQFISFEIYQSQGLEAADLMFAPENDTPEKLASAVKSLEYVEKSIVDEYGIVHVTTTDGAIFTLDPEGKCKSLETEDPDARVSVDEETLAELEKLSNENHKLADGTSEDAPIEELINEGGEADADEFADLMEIDEDEDDSIEFPDDYEEDIPLSAPKKQRRRATAASRSSTNRIVLNRYRVGIWNPWNFATDEQQVREAMTKANNFAEGHIVEVSSIGHTPAAFAAFGNYDLVFMFCHGTPQGGLSVPGTLWSSYIDEFVTSVGTDGTKHLNAAAASREGIILNFSKDKDEKLMSVILTAKYLKTKLPNLHRTIVWAAVCHGGAKNSELRAALTAKNCPAFVGADNDCSLTGILNSFRPYVLNLFSGGNSASCFENGRSSTSYSYVNNEKIRKTYNLSHTSSKVVSYFRIYSLGPTRNVIRTADLKLRCVYGSGTNRGPEFGVAYRKKGDPLSYVRMRDLAKVKTSLKKWRNCATVYDVTVRLRDLEPESDYVYYGYVSDGEMTRFSHKGDLFHTDGFTGYYHFKAVIPENYETPECIQEYKSIYLKFTEKDYTKENFIPDIFCNLTISENDIYFKMFSPPEGWYAEYKGKINNDWDYFKTYTSFLFGRYLWNQKLPSTYPERK